MKPISLEQKRKESCLLLGPHFFPEDNSLTSPLAVLSAFTTSQFLPQQELPGSFVWYEGGLEMGVGQAGV